MRVTVVTHTRGWGGTEINTLGIVRALVADGHDVTLLQCGHDLYDRFAPQPNGAARVQFALPSAFETVPARWWVRALRTLRPDVCVLSKGWFDLANPGLDLAARLVARRYVLLEHHPAEPPPARTSRRHLGGLVPGLALWYWRRQLPLRAHFRLAHRVVTDSDHVSNRLHDWYGLSRAKTFRVHPGVCPDVFRASASARARLRAEWGVDDDTLVVGTVGRFAEVKRLDRAVHAFAALRAARPALRVVLVLAGTGPRRDAVQQLAAELGVVDCLVLPGYVANAADALAALDLYVMTSAAEGFGIALVEAMACERVCVAMNSGGPGEILTDPSVGWLTPPDDQGAFEQALLDAAALSPADRAAMGRRARAHVEAHFDHRRQMAAIARLVASA